MGAVVSTIPDYAEIYKNANHIGRSVATPVCSEVMSVVRMYLRLSDLHVGVLKQPEVVKALYVFADVVEVVVEGIIDMDMLLSGLPGSEQCIVVCRVLVIRSLDWASASITHHLSRTGWFARAEPFGDTDGRLLFTQQIFLPSTDGGYLPIVPDSPRPVPRWVLEDPNILLAMEATVLISELILSYMTHATETVAEAALHVEWLNTLLIWALNDTTSGSNEEADQQLRTLLFRMQSLLKMPVAAGSHTLIVPRLQYGSYSNLINRMAQVAEIYDRDFKQLTLFIQQNEILGTYLLEQNKAFAEKEKEMEVVHSQLQNLKKTDLIQTLATLDRLGAQMREMSAAMDQAKKDMDEGLKRYRNLQTARAVFSVLNAIAQIGLAIFTGGATAGSAVGAAANAVKQASEVASRLQKVVETLEKLLLVVELLWAMKGLIEAIGDIGELVAAPVMPEMPSQAEWAIFENEIEAVADGMPEEVSEALVWKAKCKNVAAIGREIVTQAAVVGQLQYDIKVQELLREVAQNQAERLEAIQPADLKNYQEMATQLDMRTTRILLGLLKVLSVQNAALLYQYLLPPTPLSTTSTYITMSVVWDLLIRQEAAAVIALAELGSPSDRQVTYLLKGIPVGLLLDGEDWDFAIPVTDIADFPSGWSRVRISHLEMKFVTADAGGDEEVHQPTTDTGNVYMLLRGERLFADRRRGELVQYEAAVPVAYQYAYTLDTGETTEGNRPSEEFANLFMRMTPFTRWKLRLSASASENQGLAFPTATAADATTQIAISFHVSAIRTIDWRR